MQKTMQQWINFDRHHPAGRPSQRFRQDASPWTDLQDGLLGAQGGQGNDFSDDVRVDEKILAETLERRRQGRARHLRLSR
jgi:hypothetical protein